MDFGTAPAVTMDHNASFHTHTKSNREPCFLRLPFLSTEASRVGSFDADPEYTTCMP